MRFAIRFKLQGHSTSLLENLFQLSQTPRQVCFGNRFKVHKRFGEICFRHQKRSSVLYQFVRNMHTHTCWRITDNFFCILICTSMSLRDMVHAHTRYLLVRVMPTYISQDLRRCQHTRMHASECLLWGTLTCDQYHQTHKLHTP